MTGNLLIERFKMSVYYYDYDYYYYYYSTDQWSSSADSPTPHHILRRTLTAAPTGCRDLPCQRLPIDPTGPTARDVLYPLWWWCQNILLPWLSLSYHIIFHVVCRTHEYVGSFVLSANDAKCWFFVVYQTLLILFIFFVYLQLVLYAAISVILWPCCPACVTGWCVFYIVLCK